MKLIGFITLLALAFPTGVLINSYRFGYGMSDAFWRTVFAPVEGTIWAPRFDESEFSKVQIGMTTSKIIDLIGKPLRIDCGSKGCFWIYSKLEPGLPGFDQRWLIFNLQNQVTEIRKSFYLD